MKLNFNRRKDNYLLAKYRYKLFYVITIFWINFVPISLLKQLSALSATLPFILYNSAAKLS